MPNYVKNKIIFDKAKAEEVFSFFGSDGFSFKKLVPMPPHVYHGDISAEEENDFPLNWHSWCVQNWGTKWGELRDAMKIENDKAVIEFETAWSIPYPIIAAFANRFKIPFEHRYCCEGADFWGIEVWGISVNPPEDGRIQRIRKNKNDEKIKHSLYLGLWGEELDKRDED